MKYAAFCFHCTHTHTHMAIRAHYGTRGYHLAPGSPNNRMFVYWITHHVCAWYVFVGTLYPLNKCANKNTLSFQVRAFTSGGGRGVGGPMFFNQPLLAHTAQPRQMVGTCAHSTNPRIRWQAGKPKSGSLNCVVRGGSRPKCIHATHKGGPFNTYKVIVF